MPDGAPRFVLLPELAAAGEPLEIAGAEAHYLARVVRVRVGEPVRATDGRGALATLAIERMGGTVHARVLEYANVTPSATLELWCGEPEGERADWLVEKLAELGAAALVPLRTKRGDWARAERRLDRWRRLAAAALRQSCSAHLMQVRPPVTLADALGSAGAAVARVVCQPEGEGSPPSGFGGAGLSLAAVGPSSGFEADEVNALVVNGFRPVCLASGRLRTETAALAIAARWAGETAAQRSSEAPRDSRA
jgi:16S rRNA (uracil1498-N3)-methyltransferase